GEGGLCDPNPCEHGGTCTSDGVKAECDCAPGYEGPTCHDDIDECMPNPCAHMERCTDLVADFKCDCMPIDAGKRCELPRFQPIVGPGMMVAVTDARAVSADGGVVVGTFTGMSGFARPFYWTVARGPQPLNIPSSLRPDVHVYATAVSGDGTRWAGYYQGTAATDFPHPVGGTLAQSAELPTPNGRGTALDLDATGAKVVGLFFDNTSTESRAGQWTDPVQPVTLLPNPLGQTAAASAGAVTRDGTIVTGTARDSANGLLVVSWVDAGTNPPPSRRFGTMGITSAEVRGTSSDGRFAAGTMTDSAGANFAFGTQGSTAMNIAPMNGAVFAMSHAFDVNDDGTVIVGDAFLGMSGMTPSSQACTWTRNAQQEITSFKGTVMDALRNAGVQLPNWTLLNAYGVSADGKTIVGTGFDPQGFTVGFIARLP
ncbi:MAG TPA: hypothetical protein VF103_07360, partial [Polyangiaceae bacterium]